jgi:hypothetical protein
LPQEEIKNEKAIAETIKIKILFIAYPRVVLSSFKMCFSSLSNSENKYIIISARIKPKNKICFRNWIELNFTHNK